MTDTGSVAAAFRLDGNVCIITGGAGLLGVKHAEAVAEMGGVPVLLDIQGDAAEQQARKIADAYGCESLGLAADITNEKNLSEVRDGVLKRFGRIDQLINNAANNPKVEDHGDGDPARFSRLETFALETWNQDIAVGLTGAFLCSRVFGAEMARAGRGVILNVASDLGLIAPDQRLYRDEGLPDDKQPVKPVTYSVVKSGLIGLTRYLATYWSGQGVRANAIAPGGVFAGQDDAFLDRLHNLIPLGRMAHADEYKAAVVFMLSDASSYMTGSVVSVDGGRTCW
jgi:NAD(P)-dependent dehydrogenase (short-subunit alcohol dehydrogenase family)